MRHTALLLLVALSLSLLQACAQYENKRGVEVNWQSAVTDGLVIGQSTRQDILTLLGPPSQVISMNDETVLYYLFEHSEGDGLILIVYNRMRIKTRYDRAIFFFDDNDLLTEYSSHVYVPEQS